MTSWGEPELQINCEIVNVAMKKKMNATKLIMKSG